MLQGRSGRTFSTGLIPSVRKASSATTNGSVATPSATTAMRRCRQDPSIDIWRSSMMCTAQGSLNRTSWTCPLRRPLGAILFRPTGTFSAQSWAAMVGHQPSGTFGRISQTGTLGTLLNYQGRVSSLSARGAECRQARLPLAKATRRRLSTGRGLQSGCNTRLLCTPCEPSKFAR